MLDLLKPLQLATACILVGLIVAVLRALRNPLNKFPGPWIAKFTNLRLKFAVCTGQRAQYIHRLHGIYGPHVRISPTEIAVIDPVDFAQIHKVGAGFGKTDWYRRVTAQPRPSGFTMMDNRQHAQRRRLLARPFSRTHLLQHWHDTVHDMARSAVRNVQAEMLEGNSDVMKWWTFMAMDVAGKLMYGHSFNNLERGKESKLMRLLMTRLKVSGISAELPLIRTIGQFLKFLPVEAFRELFSREDVLLEHGKKLLGSVRTSEESSTIFANIAAEAEKGEKLEDIDVQVEASGLIVAGTDTTAVTLTYLVWAVLSRPALQHDLEQEVALLPEDYTDADLEKLPLLTAVIEETLRLYGAAPGSLPRAVPHGGAQIGGVFVPGGTTVCTQAYSIHRDPGLFPDPYRFLPSRWLNDGIGQAAKKLYHPFGAGSRTCLGIHLAYMEIRLACAEFFRECKGARLASSTSDASMEMENYFLIAPKAHKCEITRG